MKPGLKSCQFAMLEEEQRSVPSFLDRGLLLLKTLPATMKLAIDKFARKTKVHENNMHRDWVMMAVNRVEQESAPQHWSGNNTASTVQVAASFSMGIAPMVQTASSRTHLSHLQHPRRHLQLLSLPLQLRPVMTFKAFIT